MRSNVFNLWQSNSFNFDYTDDPLFSFNYADLPVNYLDRLYALKYLLVNLVEYLLSNSFAYF